MTLLPRSRHFAASLSSGVLVSSVDIDIACITSVSMEGCSPVVMMCMQVGWGGYLNTHEKYFYCLDALPIFVAFCVYSALHFGRYLEVPMALRLPTTAKQVLMVDDTNGTADAPVGTSASSKPVSFHDGGKNDGFSTVV